jgi:putative transposase
MIGRACLLKINKKTKKLEKSLDKYGRIKYLKVYSGTKLDIITDNRNKEMMDELHKFSRGIVEHALRIKAKTIAIGKNPGWKIKVKMGKKNNQNFVNIPFAKLIDLVRYKAEEVGIIVLDPIENHTSKCSFLDSEDICHHDKYIGRRISRGMFRSSKGLSIKKGNKTILINEINADVQGSYNILRKVSPKFTVYSIMEGLVVHGLVPRRLSISDLLKVELEVNGQTISSK